MAWLPEEKALYTGDLVFHGGTPFVLMGSVSGSFAAIDRMRAFEAQVIAPGQGTVCGPEVLDLHRAMAELDGVPEGGRIHIGRAIADMVRCNNGELLRCRAAAREP